MVSNHKIIKDSLKRKKYNEKGKRKKNLIFFLGKKSSNPQRITLNSYCLISRASRSVYSHFSLSRHTLKKYAECGLIPGIQLSSW